MKALSTSTWVPNLLPFLLILNLAGSLLYCEGFVPVFHCRRLFLQQQSSPLSLLRLAYTPPQETVSNKDKKTKKNPIFPKVGDIVRYYDLDGGKEDGQTLVGKITFIQKQLLPAGDSSGRSGWLVELTQLEDTGDGYYADFPSRQRRSKQSLRDLAHVSPIAASWVRNENAFKIPRRKEDGLPLVRAEQYDIEDYTGPVFRVDDKVVQADDVLYQVLKGRLLRYAAIAGLGGTIIADLVKGTEAAVIYGVGVLASLAYLFLLSVKTDTIASPGAKFGSNISNVRFVMPVLVLVGIALYNQSLGEANPLYGKGTFDYVTPDQFAAAVLGFLTYRLPLFGIQIQDSMKDSSGEIVLPGSAGVALQLAKQEETTNEARSATSAPLTTIFLVSGPQATGRSDLVNRLIREGQGRFVEPKTVDRMQDPVTFERIEQRGEFLSVDPNRRYGLTKEGILSVANDESQEPVVVVVDADVELARKLTTVAGLRIVGVWVGLNSVEEFERRLEAQIESGEIPIPEDETKESLVRARIKEIVKEVEFGLSSGIFEFTILNKDEESSVEQLKEAASYCL